jgi:hypothetical protein
MSPFPFPRNTLILLEYSVVTVGIGSVELVYSGVVSAFMEENGTLHLKKYNNNVVILPPTFQYLEIGTEEDEE